MTSLGNLFPDDLRKKLADENLKVGAVIRIPVTDTIPPKIKFLIIVGCEDSKVLLATVFINSEINLNILHTPELQNLQYKLSAAEFSFLHHDSYVDCSKIKERDYQAILNLIKNQPSVHVGQIDEQRLKAIRTLLRSAKTIPIRLKKKFGLLM